MSRCFRAAFVVCACLAFVPSGAEAQQASITGVVRDSSGAVLPGVTVEAASPALIEGVRTAVTDDGGRYRIEELRPGSYVLTFTLPGFATARRDGVQLTGTFVATVNADLRVGELQETITVTGDAPMVDVQSLVRQRVLDRDVLEALPSSRAPSQVAALTPNVTSATHDVGGAMGDGSSRGGISARGVDDSRILVGGLVTQTGSDRAPGAAVDVRRAHESDRPALWKDSPVWPNPAERRHRYLQCAEFERGAGDQQRVCQLAAADGDLNARFAKVVLQLNF